LLKISCLGVKIEEFLIELNNHEKLI